MTTLDKIRKLIPDITAAEKAELVQWIVRDIGGVFSWYRMQDRRNGR